MDETDGAKWENGKYRAAPKITGRSKKKNQKSKSQDLSVRWLLLSQITVQLITSIPFSCFHIYKTFKYAQTEGRWIMIMYTLLPAGSCWLVGSYKVKSEKKRQADEQQQQQQDRSAFSFFFLLRIRRCPSVRRRDQGGPFIYFRAEWSGKVKTIPWVEKGIKKKRKEKLFLFRLEGNHSCY